MPVQTFHLRDTVTAIKLTSETLDDTLAFTQGATEEGRVLVVRSATGTLVEDGYYAVLAGTLELQTQVFVDNEPQLDENGNPLMESITLPLIESIDADTFEAQYEVTP